MYYPINKKKPQGEPLFKRRLPLAAQTPRLSDLQVWCQVRSQEPRVTKALA